MVRRGRGYSRVMRYHSLRTAVLAAAVLHGLVPATLDAHHGTAAYDLSNSVTLHGTVLAFRWINPHGLIEVETRDAGGRATRWTAETAGLTILVRAGWSKTSLAPGMPVTVVGHPARNGEAAMILERVLLEDGRTLGNFVPR